MGVDEPQHRAALAVEARGFALELGQAVDLNEVLVKEIAHADEFALDQNNFLAFGCLLRDEAADFFLQLADPLAQLRPLPGA